MPRPASNTDCFNVGHAGGVSSRSTFGQRCDAVGHAEEVEDREMLASLGHDALVGGHNQKREVDASDAGQHIVDEALVAGYVDNADLAATGELQRRRSRGRWSYPGPSPRLEAVRVDARECVDESRFAVVDVAGSADDEASLKSLEDRAQRVDIVDRAHVEREHAVVKASQYRRVEAPQSRREPCHGFGEIAVSALIESPRSATLLGRRAATDLDSGSSVALDDERPRSVES